MATQIDQKEKKWHTIKVPSEVMSLLKLIKSKSGQDRANWRVIVEALSFYHNVMSSPRRLMKVDNIEKVSWYITKLSLAYSNFAINPNMATYSDFKLRCEEIVKRLGVDTSVLLKLADEYLSLKDEEKRKSKRIEFNQAIKLVIKMMIEKALGDLDEEKQM